MRRRAMVLACLAAAACSLAEGAPRTEPAAVEISHDSALLQLPGWRNEGALPTGGRHSVTPDRGGTYHAWSLELDDAAEVRLEASGHDARVRVLGRSAQRWELICGADASSPIEQKLPAGHYMVVVQSDPSQGEAWELLAACYGRGCPPPQR